MPIQRNRCRRVSALLAVVAALPSCALLAPQPRTHPEGAMPGAFTSGAGQALQPSQWWTAFDSAELTALVDQALAENLDLAQAWARLSQARALAAQAGAALYPQLDGNAGFAWSRRKSQFNANIPSRPGQQSERIETQTREYTLGLSASYEVDLWGRVRSQRRAAALDVAASRDDLETAATTLAANITELWLRIIEQRADQALLAQQLQSNQTSLELLQLRFRMAQATALDVDEQQQAVARVEAQVPLAQAEERVTKQQLAVLLGQSPTEDVNVAAEALPSVPPLPATGIPAALLIQRPDVRAGLARLRAADWRVAQARADRLPAIRLTGSAGYQGPRDDLFHNWFQTLAANAVLPIIDGGRRRAEVARTRAVVEERLAAYRQTVLTAIREVEEALVREHKQREHLAGLEKRLKYSRLTLDEARERYTKGQTDYLRVLAALTSTQGLERDLIRARRDLLVYRVNLYRALGGDWTRKLTP